MALLIYSTVDGSADLSSPFASALLGDRMLCVRVVLLTRQGRVLNNPSTCQSRHELEVNQLASVCVCVCVSCGRALKSLH